MYLIQPTFQQAGPFSVVGFAKIKLNNKEGYIDLDGNLVVPPIFDELESPYRSDAPMRVLIWTKESPCGAMYGFVNTQGKFAFPSRYEWAYVFRNGLAHVAEFGDGPCGRRASRHGFIDPTGKIVISLKFDDAGSFGQNGLAAAKVGNKWGFINRSGEFLIEPQFDDVPSSPESAFDEHGLARVKIGSTALLVNAKGQKFGSDNCNFIGPFNENGLAVVGCVLTPRVRKVGLIDTQGRFVLPPRFDNFLGFHNGYARVQHDGKWGYIDARGRIIVPPRYPMHGEDFTKSGTARVVLGYRPRAGGRPGDMEPLVGYINTSGKLIIAPDQYDFVNYSGDIGVAKVVKNGRVGFVDNEGKEVVGWFNDARPFSASGLAPVMKEDKWGYVDLSGDFKISPTFDDAYVFDTAGIAIVKVAGKFGHINTAGTYITRPIYDRVGTFAKDGLAIATLNGNSGYVDLSGNFYLKQ